jgi:hypothetical protein
MILSMLECPLPDSKKEDFVEIAPVSKSVLNCGTSYASLWCLEDGCTRYMIMPMHCGSWDCPVCRRRKTRLYRSLIDSVFADRQCYFWTMTYYHDHDEEFAWRNYNAAWNHLATLIRQRYGAFAFVRVLECHKTSNYPHLHVITDKYVPSDEFGRLATLAGFGWQLSWKRLDNTTAAAYVSKYLAKPWPREDSIGYRRTLRLRVVTMSRGLVRRPVKPKKWFPLVRYGNVAECKVAVETALMFEHGVVFAIDNDRYEGGFLDFICSGAPRHMRTAAEEEYKQWVSLQVIPVPPPVCKQEDLFD